MQERMGFFFVHCDANTNLKKKYADNVTCFLTRDLAVMTEDGYCSIVGREKDMLIRGGENIYPLEIEQILYEHPKVKDIQVS